MALTGFHEDQRDLSAETRDLHRAILSLMEELEAVDWYQQRIDVTADAGLKKILAHNRDEEKEHAAMVLEWMRRHDATLHAHLKTYLFTEGEICEIEASQPGTGQASAMRAGDGTLSIGSLRDESGSTL